ncbi:MAG: AAA family ATPase [Planctomycetaceae bacterium]
MKLSDLQVDRFGVWRGLDLAIPPGQVALLSGPNGTGKSTLLEFVRGVLFGYGPEASGKLPEEPGQVPGRVVVLQDGHRHVLTRPVESRARGGRLEIDGHPVASPEEAETFLRGVTPELWDGVFCMGLNEIQELSALQGAAVASQVYEASLGPEGRRLINPPRRAWGRQNDTAAVEARSRSVQKLIEQRRELTERLREQQQHSAPADSSRRDFLAAEISRREAAVAQLRRQQQGLSLQNRVFPAWQTLREVRGRMESLGPHRSFPEQGLTRLSEIDNEIQQLRSRGRRLMARLRSQGGFQPRSQLSAAEAAALHGFVSQKAWFVEVARQRQQSQQQWRQHLAHVEELRRSSAEGWSLDSLRALVRSPEIENQLWEVGRTLDRERLRLGRLKRVGLRLRSRRADLEQTLREGRRGLKSTSLEGALQAAHARLTVSPQATALKAREQTLLEHLRTFGGSPVPAGQARDLPPLPAWLTLIVAVFFFLGIIVAGWGFIAGVKTSAIAGLIYVFLGLTFGGIAWGLKNQYESDQLRQKAGSAQRRQQVERELQGVRAQLQLLPAEAAPQGFVDVGQTAQELSRLNELASLEHEQERLAATEHRLRQRLRVHRTRWLEARSAWSELQQHLGLAENWNVTEVIAGWKSLITVGQAIEQSDQVRQQAESLEQLWRSVETSVADLTLRAPPPQPTTLEALAQIDQWCDLLAVWQEDQIERRAWRQKSSKVRRSLRRLRRRLRQLEDARQALWVQAGAGDRGEFVALSRQAEQRHALRRELEQAESAVQQLRQDLPEAQGLLARFETSFEQPHPGELSAVEAELARQERELATAQDELAELDLEFEAWSNDPTLAELRFDLQLVEQRLEQEVQSLAAEKLAGETLDTLCRDFERRTQPETLALASDYLARLTCGKYLRIWTPLGERQLRVEDQLGHSSAVENLSRGAREQLYLALRLAVISRLSLAGIEMPLLLDDVFVNFDAPRTEAAIDLLQEVAQAGQQVIFVTCHDHVVSQFQKRGVTPLWLPRMVNETLAERRAG